MNTFQRNNILMIIAILILAALNTLISLALPQPWERQVSVIPTNPPSAEIQTPQTTPTYAQPAVPGVIVSTETVTTYLYLLDDRGQRIWMETGEIQLGAMVKLGPCGQGYQQVEYPDPDRLGWWKVEYIKCEG